jgi:hypothetical protein
MLASSEALYFLTAGCSKWRYTAQSFGNTFTAKGVKENKFYINLLQTAKEIVKINFNSAVTCS